MADTALYDALLAAEQRPAGGAALDQVIGMSVASAVIFAGLLWIAWAHRTRRITWLQRLSDHAEQRLGRPGWVAVPGGLLALALVTAFLGFIWDVSLHAGVGRDEGPLANPAHYLILVGLFLTFIAGATAMVLPLDEVPGPAAVKITRAWRVPVGGLLVAGSGLYALIGFPLDDVWHRIFGQDVTLWGPTHLMLIGGAGLSLVGILTLLREGDLAQGKTVQSLRELRVRIAYTAAFGGLLIGLSVFQVEYDFGIQQFRQPLHPMMIAAAASLALVAARRVLGAWGAILAVLFYLAVRVGTAVIVGPVLGEAYNVFPLYLGTAVVIELLALIAPLSRHRLLFGAVAGLGLSTVGLALEGLWVQAAFVLPWTSGMWLEGLLMSVPVGVLAGMAGALLGTALTTGDIPGKAVCRTIIVAGVVAVSVSLGNGLWATVPDASATVQLTDVDADPATRTVEARVTFDRVDLPSDNPTWVQITAWQGGGEGVVVDRLRETAPGVWETTRPVPVHGTWKTLVRVSDDRILAAVPIWMPADEAIGAKELAAPATFTRAFVPETSILQREKNADHPAWLWNAACTVVAICSLLLIWALSWGVARVARSTPRSTPAERRADDRPPALV
ncbi:hypothetical protein H4N58_01360 [Mumia sp. ZJ1417]|uniref:hypothetical protein n=1 Tax=Mumia sp. ZJ1417 TaxID=2708082 RepID=UPI0014242C20|nr:hypothetical protein [Mumia sp. ZJ1417]QMW66655.1 hypothetical protein H4N58_01360 [Mumia sp. ZJ1417]